jgi:hypothetical protein
VSQPPAYNRSFSFSNFQAQNPTGVPPGSQIDGELNNVKATLDGFGTNLARIQRDDGALMNGSVTFDQLSPALQTAGLAPALPWVAGTTYSVNASVTHGSAFYRCMVAHTAGTFATDLAAGNWVLIVDFATIALVAASLIAVTPSGSLTTDAQTSLQALDSGKAPMSHTHVSTAISDSTTAGRALLTAPTVAAQNVLLGTTALGFQSGDVKETATLSLQSGWYYCDGSNKNRVTDAPLFNAITIQQTGLVTSGSAVITGLADTTNGGNTPMSPGMPLSGVGIPSNAVILSVDSSTQVTMSANATGGGTTPLVFAPYGVGDGSTTFGLPNHAYIGVGRDNASGSASNITQVSTTITLTSGSATATVASAANLFIGMFASHPKLPSGTIINAISGTTLTLSNTATANSSATAVRFSPLLDAQTLGTTGGELGHVSSVGETAAHTHGATSTVTDNGHGHPGSTITETGSNANLNTSVAPGGNAVGPTDYTIPLKIAVAATGITVGTTVASNNGGLAHNNQPKTIVMNYVIKR